MMAAEIELANSSCTRARGLRLSRRGKAGEEETTAAVGVSLPDSPRARPDDAPFLRARAEDSRAHTLDPGLIIPPLGPALFLAALCPSQAPTMVTYTTTQTCQTRSPQ